MKVLLAVDSSTCSECAVEDVRHHRWPPETEIEVVSVAHARAPRILERCVRRPMVVCVLRWWQPSS